MNLSKQEFVELTRPRPGEWFCYYQALTHWPLKPSEAEMLSLLINLYRVKWDDLEDGWLEFGRWLPRKLINRGDDQQLRALSALVEGGFLEVKRADLVSGKRRIRLNMVQVLKALSGRRETTAPTPRKQGDIAAKPLRPAPDARANTKNKNNNCGGGDLLGLKEPPKFEDVCASKLWNIIATHRKLQAPANLKQWAKEFTLLLHLVGDKARVREAVKFYGKVIGQPYTPSIYSAASFRQKFFALEDAMQRQAAKQPQTVEVPEAYTKTLATLRSWTWPQGSAAQVPAVLVKSAIAYEHFRTRVRQFVADEFPTSRSHRLATHLLSTYLTPPPSFLIAWFRLLNTRLTKWKEWNGDLSSYAFRPDHPEFVRQARAVITAYTGQATDWDYLNQRL